MKLNVTIGVPKKKDRGDKISDGLQIKRENHLARLSQVSSLDRDYLSRKIFALKHSNRENYSKILAVFTLRRPGFIEQVKTTIGFS